MHIKYIKLLGLALSFSLAGCGIFGDKVEESKNWTAEKLYAEAKDELLHVFDDCKIFLFATHISKIPKQINYSSNCQIKIRKRKLN